MGEWTKGKLKPRGRFVDAAGTVDTWGGVVFSGIITCHKTRETDGDGRVWTASGNPEANAERIVACWNAMTGIEDPAAFMEEVRGVLVQAHGFAEHEYELRGDVDAAYEPEFQAAPVVAALSALLAKMGQRNG